MTIENQIHLMGDINTSLLFINHLTTDDTDDASVDIPVSLKIVDANNQIFALIECESSNMDNSTAFKGCFIKRFLYEPRLIGTTIFNTFIREFMQSVELCMISTDNGYLTRKYDYIWVLFDTDITPDAYLPHLLDLTVYSSDNNIIFHRRTINRK